MLPVEIETLEQMKVRFPAAIAEPVDVDAVARGEGLPPLHKRKHVFDFPDGMRMVASIDMVCRDVFFHVSVSGSDAYARTIKDEGLEGLYEDTLLRLSAMLGHAPENPLKAFLTDQGVLHLMFLKEKGDE